MRSHGHCLRRRRSLHIAVAILGLAAACSRADDGADRGPPPRVNSETPVEDDSAQCKDRISPTTSVPASTRRRMKSAMIYSVVGSGSFWFISGKSERWRALVSAEPGHPGQYRGKFPVWIDRPGPVPKIEVELVANGRDAEAISGSASATPTLSGLPGPVPMSVAFPRPGCWTIRLTDGVEASQITVSAGL